MNANMTDPHRSNGDILTRCLFQLVFVGHRKWLRRRGQLFRPPWSRETIGRSEAGRGVAAACRTAAADAGRIRLSARKWSDWPGITAVH